MKPEKAAAILSANLKGSKNKPSKISDFALACRTLKNHKDWDMKKMSEFFSISVTQLREIDKINDLESRYKKIADEHGMGMTTAYQLSRVDPKRRSETYKIIKNMNRDQIRDFVYFLVKNPLSSVSECKKLYEQSQLKTVTILALPISEEIHKRLLEESRKKGMTIHDYVLQLLDEPLKKSA